MTTLETTAVVVGQAALLHTLTHETLTALIAGQLAAGLLASRDHCPLGLADLDIPHLVAMAGGIVCEAQSQAAPREE